MKKRIFGILLVISLLIITPVHAKDINHFYANADKNIKFEDKVIGDSAFAGNLVDILGNIDGIGFIAGNTVNVNGSMEYGFVAGKDITVNGSIQKSIYIAGANVTISKDAKINRDVFIVSDTVTLEGIINRDASIGASELIIKTGTKIEGNVDTNADKITVQEGVTISGTLKYNENAKTNISNEATIKSTETYKETEKADTKTTNYNSALRSIINVIVVFVVITAVFSKTTPKTIKIYEDNKKYLKNAGIGLMILCCVPIVSLLLLISTLGTSLGLILIVLYILGLYLSQIFTGFILGDAIFNKLIKKELNPILIGIIGIIVLKLLMIIPDIGGLITFVSLILGLGTIYELVFVKEKKQNKEKVIEAKIKEKTKVKKN